MSPAMAAAKLEAALRFIQSLPAGVTVLGVSIFDEKLHLNLNAGRLHMERLAREAGAELQDRKTPFGYSTRFFQAPDGMTIQTSYREEITEREDDPSTI